MNSACRTPGQESASRLPPTPASRLLRLLEVWVGVGAGVAAVTEDQTWQICCTATEPSTSLDSLLAPTWWPLGCTAWEVSKAGLHLPWGHECVRYVLCVTPSGQGQTCHVPRSTAVLDNILAMCWQTSLNWPRWLKFQWPLVSCHLHSTLSNLVTRLTFALLCMDMYGYVWLCVHMVMYGARYRSLEHVPLCLFTSTCTAMLSSNVLWTHDHFYPYCDHRIYLTSTCTVNTATSSLPHTVNTPSTPVPML